jgi:glycosyltransferase involved in cell wall biosynthesis
MLIVGTGPEEKRLRAVASDLGLTECVELRGWIPHEELTDVYARASCLVLASLPVWFWEEQFGMVLAEAMAAHVPIVASSSGAIPEVLGSSGTLFAPGDWVGLADALERGPLTAAPGTRQAPDASQLKRFSATVAAGRLREVYEQLTAA